MEIPVRSESPGAAPPRFESQPGAHQERRTGPVQSQTDVQMGQPPGEPGAAPRGGIGQGGAPCVVVVDCSVSLCGRGLAANYGQSEEGGLILMAQWTSTVGAAQLARQLQGQQARPLAPGTRKPPAYRALADGVRLLVLEGRVPVAARLPAERELALALSLSRTTVAAAYEALRAEGFLESRRGAGKLDRRPGREPAAGPGPRTAAAGIPRLDDRPRLRRPARPGTVAHQGRPRGTGGTAAVRAHPRRLPGRPARPPADDRGPLHRVRHPDDAGTDHGHHRGDGSHRRHLPPLRRARRAHRGGVPELRQHPPAHA